MKIISVLEKLDKLLNSWKIDADDWILVSQYAYRLLGYDVELRKGHFNILVKKVLVPWEIKEGVEIHPPVGSKFSRDFDEFIRRTGFDFDINLATNKEFRQKEGKYLLYELPNGRRIKVQKPIGAIKEYEKLLALSTRAGLGVERLDKDIYYIKDMIKALSKKGEDETLNLFKQLLQKYLRSKRLQITKKEKSTESVTGVAASPGKVIGRVVVIHDIKDLGFISEKVVLVTEMTSPSLTVLLPKISAIVTDWGGMLSHAAILAREIEVPCVVGTQNATKVFKDGDLVEVDAENGIVRKLNS